jgi:hypothetical protein
MPGSTGSFPACHRRRFDAGRLACGFLLAALPAVAAVPDYFRAALATFSTEPPAGWAYTLVTVRNDDARTTARFDPARPPAEQWTLLELNGRAPTAKEAAQYTLARAGAGSSVPQGTFQKGDIDPASVTLVSEDAGRGEFTCRFREAATGADKMLGHLRLRLTINKLQPHVEKFVLELEDPYSPVLGVRMRELVVRMSFTAPVAGRPSLPAAHASHFLGRIFFIGMEENLKLTYSDFARAIP